MALRINSRLETLQKDAHQKSSVAGSEGGIVGVRDGQTRTMHASSEPPVLRHCRSSKRKHNELVTNTIPKLGLNDIGTKDLDRSHNIGNRIDEHGRPGKRSIIVLPWSEAVRDAKHKGHNHKHPDDRIYISKDLTAKRAELAYNTKKISDCWI